MQYLKRINHQEETEIKLDRESLTFGRAETCDVTIDKYEDISREHCGFKRYEDGVVTLTDFGTRNGTFVNGKQIFQETKLQHGDEIKICRQVEFRVIDPDSPEAKNEERIRLKDEERKKKRVVVEGDEKMSDAMSELNEELENKDFKSLMSEIVKKTKKTPPNLKPNTPDDQPNKYF